MLRKTNDPLPWPDAKKPVRQVSLWTAVIIAAIVGLTAFVLGARSGDSLLAFISHRPTAPGQLDFSKVQAVYGKLAQQFDGKLDANALIDGAKKGLVQAAGDPYTVYFTDAEAKDFLSSLDGTFSGIGAELGKKDNNLVVVSTLDGSPAQHANLLPSDIIAKVNGEDASTWSIDKAVGKIRGDKGTTVKLTIVRGQDVKDFSIVRDDITNPSVTSDITPENIGYLRIARFADDTADLAKKAAQNFKDKGVRGVILDLRGDGGGYVTAAQSVSSLWLRAGDAIVQERSSGMAKETLTATGDSILAGMPTIVLIDGGSASASEITAGALHDHNAAQLLGEKSFGKGSVQQIVDVPGGGRLKVTIAKWYTPNGKNISQEGITPDVTVPLTAADMTAGHDIQKSKAIDLLKNH